MKYLKKFNEELKSSTYKKAANELKRLGHKRRSTDLENWSKEVEIREEDRKVKELISKLSPIGKFEMIILDQKNEIVFNSEFYVILYFNSDLFIDMYDDYLRYPEERVNGISFHFDICLVPANDDEKSLEFKKMFKNSSWLGSYYISSFYVNDDINNGNNYDIIPIENDDSLFSNRKEAFKFKKEVIKSLIEEEHPWELKKQLLKAQNKIDEISKKVNAESINLIDRLLNSVKRISLNKLYID
jgi:hypothetical protein